MTHDIVQVRGLVKKFGDFVAVDHVDFSAREGEILGLLGPNGAGKSTTLSVMAGLIDADEGDITVDGHSVREDPMAVKRSLGVVPQEVSLYPTLSAVENLAFWGRMYGLTGARLKKAVDEALDLAGLGDHAKRRVETYSGGMKRRVNIAAGILHNPKVLLMDEPTVGIDPQSRAHILDTVRDLNASGMTVIYTSHYMEEVELLCDRIEIMDHGRIIASGTLPELRQLVGGQDIISISAEGLTDEIVGRLAAVAGVISANAVDDIVEIASRDSGSVLGPVIGVLDSGGIRVTRVDVAEPNLESVFLHLTGKTLRDD